MAPLILPSRRLILPGLLSLGAVGLAKRSALAQAVAPPPIDYPASQLSPSGVFGRRGVLDEDDPVDIGRVAIGQERLQVTPLQMADAGSVEFPPSPGRRGCPRGRRADRFERLPCLW